MRFPTISEMIHDTYSPLALKELKGLGKKISNISGRRELTGITIDQYYSRDLDDGIWAYRDCENHVIQVSIADVTEIVTKNSHLDWEAFSRATSVYLDTHVLHMFPEQISTDLASLNHQTKRLTLTVEITLDYNYDVISVDIFESFFYNKNRLDYQKFYQILSDKTDEISADLSYFLEIAQNLAPKRRHLNFSDDDRKICVSGDCFQETDEDSMNNPSFLIQEFMILANREVARWMISNGVNGFFRNHMPEYKNKVFEGIMQRAFYHQNMSYHFGLGLDYYCHFTSPIRRYADIVVHRQIKALLKSQKSFGYSYMDLKYMGLYINEQVYNLKKLQIKKEVENEQKRHERIMRKVINGEKIDDFSRISIHLFEEILIHVIDKKLEVSDDLKKEVLRRLDNDSIKGDLLFKLFFSVNTSLGNKAHYEIHTNKLQKAFFTYLASLPDFIVYYESSRTKDGVYTHIMGVKYNSVLIVSEMETSSSKKNIRKKMSIDLFSSFREWRDKNYYKSLAGCEAFFLLIFKSD